MTTLISFLGKSQLDSSSGYRRARYRFPDGSERETAYFGLALANHLRVNHVILLGTASSQWDLLVENVVGDDAEEELRIELFDAVRAEAVSESFLQRLAPLLERKLVCSVQPLIIPPSVSFDEQQALLARLADHLAWQGRVAIDLTHGYRHLAMLGLAAARYLAHERNVIIEGLYYGALDMTRDGITPVLLLDGLAHVQEWAEAFAAFETSGNFSHFAPLLERDGFPSPAARALEEAWSFLSLSNANDAARKLCHIHDALDTPLRGTSELFRGRLRRQLRWALAGTLADKQRLLALAALSRGDVLRAVIFGLEAFITREIEAAGADPLDYKVRENTDKAFSRQLDAGEHPQWKRKAYRLLKNIRNACAHGTPPSYYAYAELMKNPERLRREIEATLNRLNTP